MKGFIVRAGSDWRIGDCRLLILLVGTNLCPMPITVYRLAQRRELSGLKVAGAWRFQRADIDAWIEAQKNDDTLTI